MGDELDADVDIDVVELVLLFDVAGDNVLVVGSLLLGIVGEGIITLLRTIDSLFFPKARELRSGLVSAPDPSLSIAPLALLLLLLIAALLYSADNVEVEVGTGG